MTTTTDLADFGGRELRILRDVIEAYLEHGLPDGFDAHGVVPMMNMDSGAVFLTNADFDVAVLDGDVLVRFHYLPWSGVEGTLAELLDEIDDDIHPDDVEYLVDQCDAANVCPACYDRADFCQGHGPIADPAGHRVLVILGLAE